MSKPFDLCLICVALVCVAATAISPSFSQDLDDGATMRIGSQAPDLDIKHWLSDNNGLFQHTTKIESDHIYVIEFWATWCKPCIITMPHVAKLQEKYADEDVQFIAISDEDRDTIEAFLERRIPGDQEKRTFGELTDTYCLTSDPDKSVKQDYFRAAKRSRIPCAFIIGRSGLIEWIGPTTRLDEPLTQLVEGKWDREAFIVKYDEEQAADKRATMARRKLIKALNEVDHLVQQGKPEQAIEMLNVMMQDEDLTGAESALRDMRLKILVDSSLRSVEKLVRNNEPEKAIQLIDTLMQKRYFESAKTELGVSRLKIMVESNLEGADIALSEFTRENLRNPEALNSEAWKIYLLQAARGNVDKKVLEQAKITAELAVNASPVSGHILDTLAHLIYVVDGDLDKAIEVQKKAVKYAGFQVNDIRPFLNQLLEEKRTGKKAKQKRRNSDF